MSFLAVTTVGFILLTLGVAMLILGEVPFLGKRIPALRSRLIGLIFVLFLPSALGVRLGSNALFGSDAVQGPVVTWTLFGLCLFASGMILLPVILEKRERPRETTNSKKNPFAAVDTLEVVEEEVVLELELVEEPAPRKAAPAPKSRKPPAKESNPFDFS